ncbi:heparan-alpha-glucosaminide N-acetyltransferase [Teredinibacter haidensis]|uniref:heparan-alpha-glucosaminide N-acetyltransferase n=1 Tax=Teredinibacter haidensis TaxID=2731755 RepID=UPI00158811FF|nr:heparan-alpha-glucosaminide N-acetyltransferase [Teredinibacter haidensis]
MPIDSSEVECVKRIEWLDFLKGVAVLLMVAFHFFYDLSYFGWMDADVSGPSGWKPFRYLIVTIFVFSMGVSLYLANYRKPDWKGYSYRLLKLLLSSGVITITSILIFPDAWVYFGILHFMFFASVVGLIFVRYPWLCLPAAGIIFIIHAMGILPFKWPFNYIVHFLHSSRSADFVPIVPWFAVVLIGVFVGRMVGEYTKLLRIGVGRFPKSIIWMGRKSLIIYLLHQPILFSILYPIRQLTH